MSGARFRGRAALACSVTVALLVTGCVPQADVVVPFESADAQPVFASDEEALAAAVERYGDYFSAIQQLSADGSTDITQLAEFVTHEQFARELKAAEDSAQEGTYTRGESTFDRVKLQQYWSDHSGTDILILYLCIDVTHVVVVGADGTDRTPNKRPTRVALEVEFEITGTSPESIRIARSEVWPEEQYCQ